MPDRNGYPRLRWGTESYYAHRVAFEFWRPLEAGERVYRTCGNRMCTNVYHLTTERPKKRRKRRRPASAKLNRPKVRAIREAWAASPRPTQAALARQHKVSRSAISLVVRGVTWPDVVVRVGTQDVTSVAPAPPLPLSALGVLQARMVRSA